MYTSNVLNEKQKRKRGNWHGCTHTHTHTQLNLTNGLRLCRWACTVGASIARPQEVRNITLYNIVAEYATLFLMEYLSCNQRVRDG